MTVYLASRITEHAPRPLRVLDLCTGTGCISLLLQSLLSSRSPNVHVLGIDSSSQAIDLAFKNLDHNIETGFLNRCAGNYVTFLQDDIFHPQAPTWWNARRDIIISNPPYISPQSYLRDTSRSVRNYEPKAALVPRGNGDGGVVGNGECKDDARRDTAIGDRFYSRIMEIAQIAQAKYVLVEVADMAQAERVAALALEYPWDHCTDRHRCEIWRDWPAQGKGKGSERNLAASVEICGERIPVMGEGNGRAVFWYRGEVGRKGQNNRKG